MNRLRVGVSVKHMLPGRALAMRMSSSMAVSETDKKIPGINLCPKECMCKRNDVDITFKNVRLLSQFVSSQTGMILPRTITKLCMKKQKEIGKAIKLARSIGFMPYTYKPFDYLEDPKLFR
ncbi:small ribosomal subunit protein bS18m-like [Halichondria panicea]|uniref:small ribosomal subunit protein bS18m-like n=1 Tax=Halichondria panicea TaxID=6063 RepID=UPI00312BB0E5